MGVGGGGKQCPVRSEVREADTSQAGAEQWCAAVDGVDTWPGDDVESVHVGMDEDQFEWQQPEPDDADYDDYGDDDMMVLGG